MSVDAENKRVGFIGAGQMAIALARGLVSSGFTTAENIIAGDPFPAARSRFESETGGTTAETNADVISNSEILILAVKPQMMDTVLDFVKPDVTTDHLVISIAAGVSLDSLSSGLGSDRRIVRVMPNTPCLVGQSASGFSLGDNATAADSAVVLQLLSAVGFAVQVPEHLLDAVTGLSGSGPAYAYQIIEALSDGGVRMGLPRDVATKLAAQTLLGAATMVLETGQHPGALKDAVTSPGGTTIAGIHALETGGLRGCLMNAVEAATRRSKELGKSS